MKCLDRALELAQRRANEMAEEFSISKKASDVEIGELKQSLADSKLEREGAVTEVALLHIHAYQHVITHI